MGAAWPDGRVSGIYQRNEESQMKQCWERQVRKEWNQANGFGHCGKSD
jgi:hypothetical protein